MIPSTRYRHTGFSFAEVMFAVMLLGLGFIMVAAIFPVAIRQQQASMEDTTGVAVAKRGAALIQQMGVVFAQYDIPTGAYKGLSQINLTTTTPAMVKASLVRFQFASSGGGKIPYEYVKGDLIQQSDRRFAWIPVAYQSSLGSEYAQVYLAAIQSRVNDQFTDTDRDNSATTTGTGPFLPVGCSFKLVEGGTSYPDTLVFTNGPTGAPMDVSAAAEGAYVWVVSDNLTTAPSSTATYKAPGLGASNGRYYRLGVKRDDMGPGVWELQSGNDMTVTTTPGPDNDWSTTSDNQEQNENLPPRPTDSTQPLSVGSSAYSAISSPAASGLLVGRGQDSSGNFTGNNMALFALPPITVRIKP